MTQRIREDDFVHNIVADPNDPPDTLFLVGFAGRAADPQNARFYLDVMLSCYVEVPHHAILFAREISREQSPLGGWYVWIKRDADLLERLSSARRKFQQVQQDYLNDFQSEQTFGSVQPGWPVMPSQ